MHCVRQDTTFWTSAGLRKQGMFDDQLWPLAQKEERMLITTDKGFQSTALISIMES